MYRGSASVTVCYITPGAMIVEVKFGTGVRAMMPERQLSVALVLTGAALLVPEMKQLLAQPTHLPGGTLFAGALLGALGLLFASVVVAAEGGAARWLRWVFWAPVAVALAGCMIFGVLRSDSWTWRALFCCDALLGLTGPALVVVFVWRDSRPPKQDRGAG